MIEWVIFLGATSPIWGTLIWEVWERWLKPRFIPRKLIEEMTFDLLSAHGVDAAEIARINADRAHRYCDSFGEAKWRLVECHVEETQDLFTGVSERSNTDWTSSDRRAFVVSQIGNKSEIVKDEARTEETDSQTDH